MAVFSRSVYFISILALCFMGFIALVSGVQSLIKWELIGDWKLISHYGILSVICFFYARYYFKKESKDLTPSELDKVRSTSKTLLYELLYWVIFMIVAYVILKGVIYGTPNIEWSGEGLNPFY